MDCLPNILLCYRDNSSIYRTYQHDSSSIDTNEIVGHTLMNSAGVSMVGHPTLPQKLENRLSTPDEWFWAYCLL